MGQMTDHGQSDRFRALDGTVFKPHAYIYMYRLRSEASHLRPCIRLCRANTSLLRALCFNFKNVNEQRPIVASNSLCVSANTSTAVFFNAQIIFGLHSQVGLASKTEWNTLRCFCFPRHLMAQLWSSMPGSACENSSIFVSRMKCLWC